MELLELYFTFVKIGFTSFGGMSMIPLIQDEMMAHNWISSEDFVNIIAIAEMTPGPFGINCATFAGMQVYGLLGGITAVLGVLMPTYTFTLFIAIVFSKIKNNTIFESIMIVIRPICVGMLLAVIFLLSLTNYYSDSYLDLKSVFIGVIVLVLQIKYKVSVPKIILLSGVLGIIIF